MILICFQLTAKATFIIFVLSYIHVLISQILIGLVIKRDIYITLKFRNLICFCHLFSFYIHMYILFVLFLFKMVLIKVMYVD